MNNRSKFIMRSDKRIDRLLRLMQKDTQKLGAEEWAATLRVYNIAVRISKSEGADLQVVGPGALLHDLGKLYEKRERKPHQLAGVRRKLWLLSHAGFNSSEIVKILETISSHQRKVTLRVKSLEGKVLQDADNIDEIGVIGLLRSAMWHAKHGDPVYLLGSFRNRASVRPELYKPSSSLVDHLYDKLLTLDRIMNTQTGRQIARLRIREMYSLIDTLKKEILGQV